MVKCSKCNKMVDSRGLAMHMAHCKKEGGEEPTENQQIDKSKSLEKCINCSGNNIMLLSEFDKKTNGKYDIKKAINGGYTHACGDCGEALK